MKFIRFTLIFFIFSIFPQCRGKHEDLLSQSSLRHSVEEYQMKFNDAEEVTIVKHEPIFAGENVVVLSQFKLTELQKIKILELLDQLSKDENLTGIEPTPMTRCYDVTMILKYKYSSEKIIISNDRREVEAQTTRLYLEPAELINGLSTLIDSFISLESASNK